MSRIAYESNVVLITVEDDLKCVHLAWKSFAKGSDFRQGLEEGLKAVAREGVSHWLGDVRNLKVVEPEDQKWVNEDWFPRLLQQGIRHMAVVMPRSAITKMSVERILNQVTGDLTTSYFAEVDEARAWLRTSAAAA